ncbi:hypothetical protein V6Z11_D07G047100 [Gossypium hirsutum]
MTISLHYSWPLDWTCSFLTFKCTCIWGLWIKEF